MELNASLIFLCCYNSATLSPPCQSWKYRAALLSLLFGTQRTVVCKKRKRAISKSLYNYCPTLLCRDSRTCGLNGRQPAPPLWSLSAAAGCLLTATYCVKMLSLPCDRSLFRSEWHLEGHYHYFSALLGLICTSHPLPWLCQHFFISVFNSQSLHCLRYHRTTF